MILRHIIIGALMGSSLSMNYAIGNEMVASSKKVSATPDLMESVYRFDNSKSESYMAVIDAYMESVAASLRVLNKVNNQKEFEEYLPLLVDTIAVYTQMDQFVKHLPQAANVSVKAGAQAYLNNKMPAILMYSDPFSEEMVRLSAEKWFDMQRMDQMLMQRGNKKSIIDQMVLSHTQDSSFVQMTQDLDKILALKAELVALLESVQNKDSADQIALKILENLKEQKSTDTRLMKLFDQDKPLLVDAFNLFKIPLSLSDYAQVAAIKSILSKQYYQSEKLKKALLEGSGQPKS